MSIFKQNSRKFLLSTAAAMVLGSLSYAPLSNAVVPNDNNTPDDIVDTDGGVNGVGMFYRADGFVCTGTLINPRTVLFAAHCVNDVPESAWGSQLSAAFSFDVDALPGFRDWIQNGYASNPDMFVYNINQIYWHADSVARPSALGFLEADVALASLDTPAAGIPTWALLFSRLPDPETTDPVNGTGYHVNITGYGATGSGSSGSDLGIDWRRKAAENMLGALTSFNNRDSFLFGDDFGDLPQNLYHTDFDDPNKEAFYDFNLWQDEALANEGTTAGGDSGGPLILDAANNDLTDEDLVIGVLSGGSRFFGGQGFSTYGTGSFYQPLYLFADYIAANNPYRYVSAIEGDGAWEDASHWISDIDPNFRVIDGDGNIVNGFPDVQPSGVSETDDPGFGVACFDIRGDNDFDECQNMADGEAVPPSRNGEGGDQQGAIGQLTNDELNDLSVIVGGENTPHTGVEFAENAPQAAGDPLPAPTLDNGLAGATDFVPDNIDPAAGVNGTRRYFEVTLSRDGVTTLSSARTIDRLNVGGPAGLIIDADGNLTTLIDVNQTGGRVAVDGMLDSVGDYSLFSGMLSGTGTVKAPYLTSVAGTIAPGTVGTVGTLTIDGSAVLASGTNLIIDIGADDVNDVLAITGDSSLGGHVTFNLNADVRAGNEYTFVTTAGTQSGELTTSSSLTPILKAVLTHNTNSVVAEIEAGSYQDVVNGDSLVQGSYATLLDGSRGNSSLDPIYARLDLMSAEQIQGVLNSWAPVTETTTRNLAKAATDNVSRFHRNRMSQMGTDNWEGGTVTVMGNPVQMASNAAYMTSMSDVGSLQAANGMPMKTTTNIKSDYAVYLAGSFIDGSGSAMPTIQNFEDEDFDGWSITGGIEHAISEKASVGASLSYQSLDADASLDQSAKTDYLAGTLYGQLRSSKNVVLDGQLSVGSLGTKTERTVAFPSNSTLKSDDNSMAFSADLQISKRIDKGSFVIVPKAGLRNTLIQFDTLEESGGLPALTIERRDLKSTQGRIGLDLKTASTSSFQGSLSGDLVKEFGDTNGTEFDANFVGSNNISAPFLLVGTDNSWGEIGAGVDFDLGQAKINLGVDTTVGRKDIEAQTYSAGLTFKF